MESKQTKWTATQFLRVRSAVAVLMTQLCNNSRRYKSPKVTAICGRPCVTYYDSAIREFVVVDVLEDSNLEVANDSESN